jgi:hypothetical protein
MATTGTVLDQQAEAYERHLRENWDRLPTWEREQAERYFAWRSANPRALIEAPAMVARPARDDGLSKAVKAGYLCAAAAFLLSPLVFAPVTILIGIYNITRGRYGHGIAQIVLAVVGTVLAIVLSAIMLEWLQILLNRLEAVQSGQR